MLIHCRCDWQGPWEGQRSQLRAKP